MKLLKNILLPLGLILSNLAYANTTSVVKHFPETLDKNCKDGLAKLYDECGDQSKVLNSAINLAKKENKTVLIVYGAEWCIWCHVFDKYIKGEIGSYEYKWRLEKDGELVKWDMKEYTNSASFSEASQLKKFVATNFVVAHIESDKTNGKQALEKVGVDTSKIYAVPAIIGLNKEGKYSGEIPPASLIEGLEVRESGGQEYRGYNRLILLEQLKQLRNKSK